MKIKWMSYDSYLELGGKRLRTLSMERKEKRKNTRPSGQLLYMKNKIGDETMVWVEALTPGTFLPPSTSPPRTP